MPSQMSVNLNYIETVQFPEGQRAADFSYAITCPVQGCFACQTLEAFLTGAALVPDLSLLQGWRILVLRLLVRILRVALEVLGKGRG